MKSSHYDDNFYQTHFDLSMRSAQLFVSRLWAYYQPTSVVDVGCGRGAWLKVFAEMGVRSLTGVDGPWNSAEKISDERINFVSQNLETYSPPSRSELVICMEVAEHLSEAVASDFVANLCNTSDVVLFSAAYPGQGGTNHLNERYPSYWASLFGKNQFQPYDLFRPAVWSDPECQYFYAQNGFLYVREGSDTNRKLNGIGASMILDLAFMDIRHPSLPFTGRELLRMLTKRVYSRLGI